MLSITRSVKFAGYIWKACNSRITLINTDVIIPWGFQETAGKYAIKRELFDSSGGILCNPTPVHFCATRISYLIDPV